LPNISKYCVARNSAASASSKLGRMLTPSSGRCSMPLTKSGCGNARHVEDGRGHLYDVGELVAGPTAAVTPTDSSMVRASPSSLSTAAETSSTGVSSGAGASGN
jgi:hypothetical protein